MVRGRISHKKRIEEEIEVDIEQQESILEEDAELDYEVHDDD